MLNKKQYFITLGASVVVFFIIYIVSYYISFNTNDSIILPTQKVVIDKDKSKLANSPKVQNNIEEVSIVPSTKVTLELKDINNNQIQSVVLDPATLLGHTKEAIQDRFTNYVVETFSEDEVTLVKTLKLETANIDTKNNIYVLAIDNDKLCIKEKSTGIVCGYISRELSDLSSYLYSEFLKENIEITDKEKEKLLIDGSFLQIILQDYESE